LPLLGLADNNPASCREKNAPPPDLNIKMNMSIRMLAKELYLLHQKVETLENKIENAPEEKRADLKDQLRKLKAERLRMRNALDGRIDSATKRPKF